MSMSDDPRGFRRGQPGARVFTPQPAGARAAQPAPDRFPPQQDPSGRQDRRPPDNRPAEKSQPSFSAYRPEAYAANDRGKPQPAPGRQERPSWDDGGRNAPPASSLGPTSEPFPRTPQQARDPYYQGASSDPYATPQQRGYEDDWRHDGYQDQGSQQLPSFYPTHEEQTNGANPQQMHDHFFASDHEADPLPPPPQPLSGRLRNAFDDHDFDSEPMGGQGNYQPANNFAPAPTRDRDYGEPAQRHHGVHGFDDNQDPDWEKFDQAPPPAAVRPFHPPATIPEDDMDADFFADEDDYDPDEFSPDRRGGRKRMMAAVLVGAVVAGGGLAYLYKAQAPSGGGDGPSVVADDSRPVKGEPADPGGRTFANGSKLIYDRISGDTASTESAPQSRGNDRLAAASTAQGGGTLEERIENALKAQKEDPSASGKREATSADSSDAPRRVQTLTFDVNGNPKQADQRTQRVQAGGRSSAANLTVQDNVNQGIIVTTAPTAADAAPAAEPKEAEAAPEPQAQPAPRAQAKPQRQAALAPAPATPQIADAATSSAGAGQFFVQIAARNDQEAAVAAFATLQQKYASVLGNHSPSVRKADLGDKGVWYRLMVGPMESKAEADQLCEQLKSAGMKGCFARKE